MSEHLSGKEVLAIDAGTQGLSVIIWCPERKQLMGLGEARYEEDYIPGLPEGRLEQYPRYWSDALRNAMVRLGENVRERFPENCGMTRIGTVEDFLFTMQVERKFSPSSCKFQFSQ